MTVKDIYLFLDKIAPFSTAADWDNSGLQLGGFNTESADFSSASSNRERFSICASSVRGHQRDQRAHQS